MATLYDENDQPIEGALTPDEAKVIQEKAARVEELEKNLAEKDAEYKKLKDKDMNFEAMKEMNEARKAELLDKASSDKKLVLQELFDLRKGIEDEKKAKFEEARRMLLDGLAGNDESLQKAIELRAKQWGDSKTIEEMKQRYSDAAILEKAGKPDIRTFNAYYPTTSYQGDSTSKKRFTDTQEGKDLMTTNFPQFAKKIYKEKQ